MRIPNGRSYLDISPALLFPLIYFINEIFIYTLCTVYVSNLSLITYISRICNIHYSFSCLGAFLKSSLGLIFEKKCILKTIRRHQQPHIGLPA